MNRPYDVAGNFRVDFVLDQDPPSDQCGAATDRSGRLPIGGGEVKHHPFAVPFDAAAKNCCAGIRNLVAAVDNEGVVARSVHSIVSPSRSRSGVDAMVEITG